MAQTPELEKFLRYLKERGMRVTQERLALFDEIYAQHEHIDADRLLGAMQDKGVSISRATVYRNLDLLVECGLVRKHRLGRHGHLFEHVHAGQDHDHMVCSECGRVVEFVSPTIAAMSREICRAHGFVPGRVSLEIQGICVGCEETEDADPRPGSSGRPAGSGAVRSTTPEKRETHGQK